MSYLQGILVVSEYDTVLTSGRYQVTHAREVAIVPEARSHTKVPREW
jgi:hypothetical protein